MERNKYCFYFTIEITIISPMRFYLILPYIVKFLTK